MLFGGNVLLVQVSCLMHGSLCCKFSGLLPIMAELTLLRAPSQPAQRATLPSTKLQHSYSSSCCTTTCESSATVRTWKRALRKRFGLLCACAKSASIHAATALQSMIEQCACNKLSYQIARCAALLPQCLRRMQAAEEAWEADALERAASLARASLATSLPTLHSRVTEAHAATGAAGGNGRAHDHAAALERLAWLLRLAAAVLADSGLNETPMVPVEVLEMCEDDGVRGAAAAVAAAAGMGASLCQARA